MMNSVVGVFAGRGDVILAMGMTAVLFFFLGWKAKSMKDNLIRKFSKSS